MCMQTIAPPVWAEIQPKDPRFLREEVLVAGYTLTDFIDADTADCAPMIQTLLDRLAAEGGGALYIPAGEYVCRTPIVVPKGDTLVGDWQQPDGKSPVCGTILVWCGPAASAAFDAPFVSVEPNAVVRDLAFWYPAQSETHPIPYPPTIRLTYWDVAKEITFINAWVGIEEVAGDSPSMYNVYGTALSVGILDRVVTDIMRIEDTYFSPDYWLCSGKFTGDEQALRRLLYTTAVGVYLERTDWSYYTESGVDGYYKGVVLNSYGCYGQMYDLHIQNCCYGMYVNFTHGNGQAITRVTMDNCEYGVYAPADGRFGAATMHDVRIGASREAIGLHCPGKYTLVDSVIAGGRVVADCAMLAVVNSAFQTTDAVKVQVGGTAAVMLAGNRGLTADNLCVEGDACACHFSEEAVPGVSFKLNEKQAAAAKTQVKRPRGTAVYSADRLAAALGYTLDKTGATDTAAVLNACLCKVGESGGVLYLPSGHYRLAETLIVPADVELCGAIDCARVPHNVGTVLDVDFETGHAVVLSAHSGLRGVTISYLGQTAAWIYEHGAPRAYDFAVYAKDAPDVYVINVSSYNCYRGVCLDGCDRHYVEGIGGAFMYRGVEVRRAADGIVRDCQFNIQALFRDYGWPTAIAYRHNELPEEEALRPLAMHFFDMLQGECQTYVLDNVTDEMVYGCFTYGGGKTLVIKGEETTATMIGYASDTVRHSVDVQGGRAITMINTQMAPYTPKEYTNHKFTEVYGVYLRDTFRGVCNMINSETWARPRVMFKVDGGTLNVYNDNVGCGTYEGESHVETVTLAQVAKGASAQISAVLQYHPSVLIEDDTVVNGGFCGTGRLIGAKNMMRSTECYEE